MSFLKKIARKILASEINETKTGYDKLFYDYNDVIKKRDNETLESIRALEDRNKFIDKLKREINDLREQIQIMRQYYDLDKEPTDEEKIKIRIDLKIHDLEMQMLKEKQDHYTELVTLSHQPRYIVNPYWPIY